MAITSDLLVDDVMARWPATIRVFLDLRIRCVGCPIACFHTVADAAREHGVDCGRFVAALRIAGNADDQRARTGRREDGRHIVPSP